MNEDDVKYLELMCAKIMERFECCQIIVSRKDEWLSTGLGNSFARRELARMWLGSQYEKDRMNVNEN